MLPKALELVIEEAIGETKETEFEDVVDAESTDGLTDVLEAIAGGCGESSSSNTPVTEAKTEDELKLLASNINSPVQFMGFVGGAFPVTVDAVGYEDSEDFFTEELARLPSKVAAAGYDNSWTVTFEAALA